MNQAPKFTRRARWAVPSGAVAAVGVVLAGSVLTSAQAAPSLQPRTPAQLIAAIAGNKSVPASMSGTITTNAALGLPDLPGTSDPASVASLLTGSHTIKIWYARPGQLRLALPVPLGETDLRVNGRQVWLWDSQRNTATRILPPAVSLAAPPGSMSWSGKSGSTSWSAKPRSSARFSSSGSSASSSTAYQSTLVTSAPTPQQVARQLLAAVGPTTVVGAASNVMVAGRAAYQLTLAPKNAASLIGRVSIAVDGSRYFPLRVQVFARGAASPAFQIGYTSISFARPAASNFAFTPPPGAKVKTVRPSAGLLMGVPFGALRGANGGEVTRAPRHVIIHRGTPRLRELPKRFGTVPPIRCAKNVRWTVPLPKGSLTMNPLRAAMKRTSVLTPKHLSKSQRQQLLKMLRQGIARASCLHAGPGWHGAGWYAYSPLTNTTFPPGLAGAPRVIGSGWTTVGVFPAGNLTGQAGGPAGILLRSATAVHGSWGSGRLLRTSLVSVLITSNGKALIGAVTPSVLYAAAAQAK